MSVDRILEVTCSEQFDACFGIHPILVDHEGLSDEDARELAADEGWKYEDEKDICPACQPGAPKRQGDLPWS